MKPVIFLNILGFSLLLLNFVWLRFFLSLILMQFLVYIYFLKSWSLFYNYYYFFSLYFCYYYLCFQSIINFVLFFSMCHGQRWAIWSFTTRLYKTIFYHELHDHVSWTTRSCVMNYTIVYHKLHGHISWSYTIIY